MRLPRCIPLLLGTVLGCDPGGGQPTDLVPSAILVGTETDLRPEVGVLQNGCTATMFTNQDFLTAAHCFDSQGLTQGGSLTVGTTVLPVGLIFSLGHNQGGTDDLAVGRILASLPNGVRPASLGFAAPSYDTLITQIGYGCTDRNSRAGLGTKRFRTFTRRTAPNVGCFGDSGGPSFLGQVRDNGDLVLVFSGWNSGGDFHADPGKHRDEIFAIANDFSTQGVCYRGHVANTGWLPPACNGEVGGRDSDDLQALHIWTARPGLSICYSAFSAGVGWWAETCGGVTGVTGQSRPIQALKLRLATSHGERLVASANVAGLGWQPPVDVTGGGQIGIVGRGLRGITVQFQ